MKSLVRFAVIAFVAMVGVLALPKHAFAQG
jgi:hypothetical protein